MDKEKLDYAAAGVDIEAADRAVDRIKKLARTTFNDSVLADIGSFGGFFKPDFTGYKNPVFISSTDSVGTKLKIAFLSNRHNTPGEDLVNHCVNDILVHGARPLFFLDYIGIGKVVPGIIEEIVEGFANGCKNAGMALIAGEIAEMPDIYAKDEYDLVGFIVGMVDQGKIINGSAIKAGDLIIGLSSNGLHTNGYTLARKAVFEVAGMKPDNYIDSLGMTISEALLAVHRSYLKPVKSLIEKYNIKGMAHITGGGISGNLIRIIPENLQAVITKSKWEIPPIFKFIKEKGPIQEDDMYQAFNMGIGYILVVSPDIADNVIDDLKKQGESPYIIGEISPGSKNVILRG